MEVPESVAVEPKRRHSGIAVMIPTHCAVSHSSISHRTHLMVRAQQIFVYTTSDYHVVFFCQQMDAPPSLTPSVGGGEDESSAIALTQEAARKVQQLERERDSLKAERHMYQMKWLAAEDMLEAVKSDRQSLEVPVQLCTLVKLVDVTGMNNRYEVDCTS